MSRLKQSRTREKDRTTTSNPIKEADKRDAKLAGGEFIPKPDNVQFSELFSIDECVRALAHMSRYPNSTTTRSSWKAPSPMWSDFVCEVVPKRTNVALPPDVTMQRRTLRNRELHHHFGSVLLSKRSSPNNNILSGRRTRCLRALERGHFEEATTSTWAQTSFPLIFLSIGGCGWPLTRCCGKRTSAGLLPLSLEDQRFTHFYMEREARQRALLLLKCVMEAITSWTSRQKTPQAALECVTLSSPSPIVAFHLVRCVVVLTICFSGIWTQEGRTNDG